MGRLKTGGFPILAALALDKSKHQIPYGCRQWLRFVQSVCVVNEKMGIRPLRMKGVWISVGEDESVWLCVVMKCVCGEPVVIGSRNILLGVEKRWRSVLYFGGVDRRQVEA